MKNSYKKTEDAAKAFRDEEDIFLKSRSSQIEGLTYSQIKEIGAFWAPYSFAYKNNPAIQCYFSVVSGVFDPSYITPAFHRHFLNRFLDTFKIEFICDKSNFPILFSEVRHLPPVFRRFDGIYYNNLNKIISKKYAIDILLAESAYKKALTVRPYHTGGVQAPILANLTSREEIIYEIDRMGDNDFICQEYITSHKTWRFSSSIST